MGQDLQAADGACDCMAAAMTPARALFPRMLLAGVQTIATNHRRSQKVWDYTVNFLRPVMPYPDWFAVGENLAFWKKHKTIGYMAQGSTDFPPGASTSLVTLCCRPFSHGCVSL